MALELEPEFLASPAPLLAHGRCPAELGAAALGLRAGEREKSRERSCALPGLRSARRASQVPAGTGGPAPPQPLCGCGSACKQLGEEHAGMGFCFVLVKLKCWGFKKFSPFYKLKFEAYLGIWFLRGVNELLLEASEAAEFLGGLP